jgi:hypothetical protein
MTAALAERLAKFGLHLHEDKTRLIEFGRFAEGNRRRKGRARPEVFDFLGFMYYCGKTRDGRLPPLPEDPKEADDPQAEGAAPGDEATDAPTAPRRTIGGNIADLRRVGKAVSVSRYHSSPP